MKRYIKLSIITILLVLKASSCSYASQDSYLRNTLDPVDIEADYLLSNGDIVRKARDAKVLVIVSNDLKNVSTIDTSKYEKLIILCVDDVNSKDSCFRDFSDQGVSFEPLTFNSLTLRTGVFKNMHSVMLDEGYLFSHKYMATAGQFLDEFASQNPTQVESKKIGFKRNNKPGDFLLDTFLTVFLTLLVVLYIYIRTSFQKAKLYSGLRCLELFIQTHRQVIKLLLVVLAVASALTLVFFLILISYRDLKELNVIYMYDYIKGVSALKNFKIFAAHGSYVKIVLQFFYVLSVVSFFSFLALDTGKELKSLVIRSTRKGLNDTNYWLLMLGHLMLIILFSGMTSPFTRVLLIFVLISLIFLLIVGYTHSIDFKKMLSIKRILFSIMCVSTALIAGVMFTTTRYASDKHLANKDELIVAKDYLLPISVEQGQLFTEESGIFKSDGAILIDNLLVYHPDYKIINNIPFNEYSDSQEAPFIIFAFDETEYLKELNKPKQVPTYLLSDAETSYFSLKTGETKKSEVRGIFEVSCSIESTKPVHFTIKYYMKNKEFAKRLVTFPGCRSNGVEKISVPIELPNGGAAYHIDFGSSKVVNYSFYKDGVVLRPIYYKDPFKDKLLYEVAGDSDVLTVYSIGLTESVKIERRGSALNLNQLISQTNSTKESSSPNVLWSFTEMTSLKFIANE